MVYTPPLPIGAPTRITGDYFIQGKRSSLGRSVRNYRRHVIFSNNWHCGHKISSINRTLKKNIYIYLEYSTNRCILHLDNRHYAKRICYCIPRSSNVLSNRILPRFPFNESVLVSSRHPLFQTIHPVSDFQATMLLHQSTPLKTICLLSL